MERNTLNSLAQEIANTLGLDMGAQRAVRKPEATSIVDLLLQQLAEKLAALLIDAGSDQNLSDESVEGRLQKAEMKLKRMITNDGGDDDDDEDEISGTGSSFPNLKYAKPKYKNVDSVLKYVDQAEELGGVKLVIMNFND